jgi:cell division protein FtsB
MRILPRGEAGLRAVFFQAKSQAESQVRERAPSAEAAAVRWVERARPGWSWLALEWRRIGTIAALLLFAGILLHAMFGANGMVIYRQKRAEMQTLSSEVESLRKENSQHVDQIRSLKSDPAAIEKEAREQLHYTKRGEVVYVAPDVPQKAATSSAKNGK